MPRPRLAVPSYRLHRASGQAIVTVRLPDGSARDITLGRYDSPESRDKYARICSSLLPGSVYAGESGGPCDCDSVIVAYLKFAAGYFDSRGERDSIRHALQVLHDLHGATPAVEFGPLALKAVREAMVRKGWSRQYCNRQARRITKAFRWAASEELVPASVPASLATLPPLRAGKTTAREMPARLPADPAHVAATLPHLPPHVRALVELLRMTGMRPAEACGLTFCQIDRSGPVWVYRPAKHKTAHQGKGRAILLGPKAQAVILAHLCGAVPAAGEVLFSPARQQERTQAEKRAKRRSKVQPSQVCRKKLDAKRRPGARYTPTAVGHAVARACKAAGVPVWTPYQLRHLVGAEVREAFTLEHVRAALGHSHAAMSAHYAAGADRVLAEEVAARVG